MNQEKLELIKNFLKAIEREKYSFAFLEPVDYVGLNLLDYPVIIKHPMDLGTVRKKIDENKYETVEDIQKDIQLVWDNCKTYNMEGCDIYKAAQACEKFTKRYFEKFGITPTILSSSKSAKKTNKSNVKTSSSASKTTNNLNNPIPNSAPPIVQSENIGNGPEVKPFNGEILNNANKLVKNYEEDDAEDENPNPNGLTSNERFILANRVKKLQNDGLASLVRLVQKDCPSSIKETDEHIEIMLCNLDKKTHEQINRLIDTFLRVKETNQENLDVKKK